MDYHCAKEYFLQRPQAMEDFPFGKDVSVFKIKGKMFATLSRKGSVNHKIAEINLKCDPDEALALRDIFESIIPGYHMNKKHWNTIILDGSVPLCEMERMIDRSYALVVKGLKKPERMQLERLYSDAQLYR